MSLPRVPHLLAGIVVALAAAPSLAVAFDATALLAAFDGADAAFVGLGFALSALTAMVGTLVIADVRTDLDHARSWWAIRQFEMSAGRAATVDPAGPYDPRYVDDLQDEGLQRLLLGHRFLAPQAFATDRLPRVARANPPDLDAPLADRNFRNAGSSAATATPRCERATDTINRGPTLVASTYHRKRSSGGGIRAQGIRGVVRAATTARLVANAGRWPTWPGQATVTSRSEPNVAPAADVIVLADRSGRQLPPPDHGLGADAAAPAHPGCRGPPSGEDRHAVVARTSGRAASDRTRPPRGDASTTPGVPVVVDNLPDRVPVCAAELDAIETYLDDVLREVLGGDSAGRDGTVP